MAQGEQEVATRQRKSLWRGVAISAVILAALGAGMGFALTGSSKAPVGPENVPIQNAPDLAPASSTADGTPVDGITCQPNMNIQFHIHVRLDIYVNGQERRLPAGAGIVPPWTTVNLPGGLFINNSLQGCVYWLHVHAYDGIIHVEAPAAPPPGHPFVLGEFFDVWRQPLGPDQVGPAQGPVVAFVDGKRFPGNPRDIPLTNLEVVQLDVGTPVVPFHPLKFTVTGLCSSSCGALSNR